MFKKSLFIVIPIAAIILFLYIVLQQSKINHSIKKETKSINRISQSIGAYGGGSINFRGKKDR